MTTDEQRALITKAEQLTRDARVAMMQAHGTLTTEQHACERRLSYAYDCLSDALGYLADANTFVTGEG